MTSAQCHYLHTVHTGNRSYYHLLNRAIGSCRHPSRSLLHPACSLFVSPVQLPFLWVVKSRFLILMSI